MLRLWLSDRAQNTLVSTEISCLSCYSHHLEESDSFVRLLIVKVDSKLVNL